MRQILFKAKKADDLHQWVYGYLLPGDRIQEENGINIFIIIPETVCEFTGAYDKNGNKVFEGDIVKVPASRLSYSNWWQETNKNHGFVGDYVHRQVVYDSFTVKHHDDMVSGFKLKDLPITEEQTKEIAKPRGKERTEQYVNYHFRDIDECEVIGNIHD